MFREGLSNKADYESAQDNLRIASMELEQAKKERELARETLGFEVQTREQQVVRQQSVAEELEKRVGELTVRAPFDGMVASVAVQDRDAVAANQPVLTVVNLSSLEVEIGLPEEYVADERLTPELRRQEVAVWKKAIRLINHELNNTIAPISSLFHSARVAQALPQHQHKVDDIYATIEERLAHLRGFLESYAQFARLPEPRRERTRWSDLLDDVRALYDFRIDGTPPEEAFVDRAQMQQVLINLIKNAHESGSDPSEVVVSIRRTADGTILRVVDRGRGMSEDVMRQALLPFYSTKPSGTGIGLALCNEIIEAHGGRLRLQAREGGGTVVTAWMV